MRQITHTRNVTTWFALMLDRAVAFLPTGGPMVLVVLDWLIAALAGSHPQLGGQTDLVFVSLFLGRLLREGLASGKIVKDLNATREQYRAFIESSHAAVPVGPYAPGNGIPWARSVPATPPPGTLVDNARGY